MYNILIFGGKEQEFQFQKMEHAAFKTGPPSASPPENNHFSLYLFILVWAFVCPNIPQFSINFINIYKCLYFSPVQSENTIWFNSVDTVQKCHVKHLNDVKKVWAESGLMAHHVAVRGATNQTWHGEGLEVLPHILSHLKAVRHKFVTFEGSWIWRLLVQV